MQQSSAKKGGKVSGALRGVLLALLSLFVLVCLLLFVTERWLFKTWSLLDLDEIIYHVVSSVQGTNPEMVSAYLWNYGVFVLLAFLAFWITVLLTHKNRFLQRVVVCLWLAVSVGFANYALIDAGTRVDLSDYLLELSTGKKDSGDFYYDNYIDPKNVEITFPEEKRNLIYIYLESMEMTYADTKNGGAFSENLIPELTELSKKNENFSGSSNLLNGAVPVRGTTWTMGAMFGQTSGLPLKLPISSKGVEYQVDSNFFPMLTSLGDLLDAEGYHQVLMLGSDAVFAGRESYFTMHGDYEMLDYKFAKENGLIPKDYYVFWGYEDLKLFDFAKDELTKLAAEDEPFNLTLLTVDTHFEDGYVCPLCERTHDNQYADVMSCSSRQVASFVEWIQQQDFYENTTIVICGDHLTMDKDFCNDVPKDYQRRTVTAFLNSAVKPMDAKRTRSYTTLDMFPTTLASLGVTIKGNRLGLGTNLFSVKETLLEEYGYADLDHKLHDSSAFMNQFMNVHITEDFMAQVADKAALSYRVENNGKLTFVVDNSYILNSDSIQKAELQLTDAAGKTTTVPMTVYQPENDPNIFSCYAKTDLTEADIKGLKAEAFFSVEGFQHYSVATAEY